MRSGDHRAVPPGGGGVCLRAQGPFPEGRRGHGLRRREGRGLYAPGGRGEGRRVLVRGGAPHGGHRAIRIRALLPGAVPGGVPDPDALPGHAPGVPGWHLGAGAAAGVRASPAFHAGRARPHHRLYLPAGPRGELRLCGQPLGPQFRGFFRRELQGYDQGGQAQRGDVDGAVPGEPGGPGPGDRHPGRGACGLRVHYPPGGPGAAEGYAQTRPGDQGSD